MTTWLLIWLVIGSGTNPQYPPTIFVHVDTFTTEAACEAAIVALSQAVSVGQRVQIDAACVKA